MVSARSAQLDALTAINADDLLGALGQAELRRGRRFLQLLCRPFARRFAQQVVAFDDAVGALGLQAASVQALHAFGQRVALVGYARPPASGPLLLVANHPGLADTLALFAAIARDDLRVIAAPRPFLQTLPHVSRHLLYIADDPQRRTHTLRVAARHLRDGGALLTFPGGAIEPDPALRPDAREALARWSNSVGLLARLSPEAAVVPLIVGGVLSPQAQRHPLTRLRRTRPDREWLGAIIQLIAPQRYPAHIQVRIGKPVVAPPAALDSALIAAADQLMVQLQQKR
jgi:1-acyl-sn-glycerol-3-phosphate acyltransferase